MGYVCSLSFSWHKKRTMNWTVLGASIISRKYLMVYDEWANAKWIKNEFSLQTNLRILWQGSGDSPFLSLSTVPPLVYVWTNALCVFSNKKTPSSCLRKGRRDRKPQIYESTLLKLSFICSIEYLHANKHFLVTPHSELPCDFFCQC